MSRQQRLIETLTECFQPERLEVIDESEQHAGHAGAHLEGETHYRIIIKAAALQGLSRIEQHRRVQAAIAAEWRSGLHALAITVANE